MTFIAASSAAYAEVALKADYISFTEGTLKDMDVDNSLYVGIEAYGNMSPNLYLGMEIGYTKPDGSMNVAGRSIDTELTFVPVELNMKYATELAPNFTIDFGAGGSYNYAKLKGFADGRFLDDNNWLFGGQVFGDVNYRLNQFFVGVNGKYQITEKFKDTDTNLNNWRFGVQVGMTF